MIKKQTLLISSIIMFPLMLGVFQITTRCLPLKWAYLLGFVVYWTFALILTWGMNRRRPGQLKAMFKPARKTKHAIWFYTLALIPVPGVFIISFLPHFRHLTPAVAVWVGLTALINGAVEEIYWRGLYLNAFKDSTVNGFILPSILFGLWHIALWFIPGIQYHGGFPALVGGAFFMGLLWAIVSRRLESIRICVIAHILVNTFAFTGLFVENGF